ncbi:hypothetical protein [Microbacterium gorillae]|uniref:hypothetical protein n=1 Tax=Microbacterium gorillae TaxID=1231063 RepID=UPI00058C517A|nr:hypothetical protein [Microbacterium gorillae]
MRVLLKFTIACDAAAAWRAVHSPTVLTEITAPLIGLESIDGLPTAWEPGDEGALQMRAAGVLPVGKQLVHISETERVVAGARVRILRDTGIPLSGPLAALDVWDHQIATSPVPGHPDRTLWRDRLVIGGAAAPVLWPALWAAWQWRQARIVALAPSWAYDPEFEDA